MSWRCNSSGGKWDALIKKLIEAGANPNNYPDNKNGTDITVMGMAAEKCSVEIVEYLLEAGASAERGFGYKAKPIERARNDEIRELIRKHACKTVPVQHQEICNQMPFDHL